MKENIIKYLKDCGGEVRIKRIYKHFKNLKKSEIDKNIDALLKEGKILKIDNNKIIALYEKNYVIGKLTIFNEGYGFVDPLSGEKGIFIPPKYIGYSLPNDIVLCRFFKNKRNKIEGRIEKILERSLKKTVCKVYKKGKILYLKPVDLKLKYEFKLNLKKLKLNNLKLKDHDFIVVSVGFESDPKRIPKINIIEKLDDTKATFEFDLLLHKYGFDSKFSLEVEKEAEKINPMIESELNRRVDLRDSLCFTIDPDDAKDFDDAVGIQKLPDNKYRLFVHIADVSFYVKQNSLIDKSAYIRGTSVYLPGRCIPMLPEKLSNEICSLKPFEDRLTFTVEMVINQKANVEKFKIYESVINSKARLTYKTVQKILDKDYEAQSKFPYLVNALFEMKELAEILNRNRIKRGALDFDLPEPEITLDENGIPLKISKTERIFSQKIIEEFMIIANETVAKFMEKSNFPSIYRIHPLPDYEKVKEFIKFLKFLGINVKFRKLTPKFFQSILKKIEGRPEEKLINYLMLRTMAVAKYSPENIGHFGLSSKCYTHFTSPIRRYADLLLHRLLKIVLSDKYEKSTIKFWEKRLDKICNHITAQSIKAEELEREAIELKVLQFISNEIGNQFESIITKITERELIVELIENLVEGTIPFREIEDDYYIIDKNRYFIKGKKTNNILKIGDRLLVQLVSVDIPQRKVKFKLIGKLG